MTTRAPFTLPCPNCRVSDLMAVGPSPDSPPAEVFYWCVNCGYEEVWTPNRTNVFVLIEGDTEPAPDDEDTQPIEIRTVEMDATERAFWRQLRQFGERDEPDTAAMDDPDDVARRRQS